MDKRTFLKLSAITGTGLLLNPFYACQPKAAEGEGQTLRDKAFELPPLPYDVAALEPHIDAETMGIHHGKHHAGYVAKLNEACAGTPYETMPLEAILANVKPEESAVRNNGGGHWNHSLFWESLSPAAGQVPTGALAERMAADFGSVEAFKAQFSQAAKGVFGSGWAWLCADAAGQLFISTTPNQDNPLMAKVVEKTGRPILGLDVWEHAYYLKYQNLRGDYIGSFFNIINWAKVGERFAAL